MPVNNGEKRNENQNFGEKHRFIKGNTVAKGKRKRTQERTQTDKSIEKCLIITRKIAEN